MGAFPCYLRSATGASRVNQAHFRSNRLQRLKQWIVWTRFCSPKPLLLGWSKLAIFSCEYLGQSRTPCANRYLNANVPFPGKTPERVSCAVSLSPRPPTPPQLPNSPAHKNEFRKSSQSLCSVQPSLVENFSLRKPELVYINVHPASSKRDVRPSSPNVRRGAMDAKASETIAGQRGRRRRVVLSPRRWGQPRVKSPGDGG